MKKLVSEKNIGGVVRKVTVRFDMDEAVARHGKDRIEELVAGWVVAHPVAEAFKRAYDVPEKAGEATVKRAAELRKRIEAGEEFDGSDFLPKPRGVDKVVLMIREKWEASDKKAEFLKAYKLDAALVDADAEVVELAYLESKSDSIEL